jgi:hypothetical protein
MMNAKLYLTIAAIVALLYGLGFVLIPGGLAALYGVAPEPDIKLTLRFFGATLLALGVVEWFAKDFRDWEAVRGVLIAGLVGNAVGCVVNLRGTFLGLMNGLAWSSTLVYVLLLVGGLYCLSTGPRKSA